MTYQKLTKPLLPYSGDAAMDDGKKKPLNDEVILKNRGCQATVAKNHRLNSSIRNDVDQTTDVKAFDEMLDYIKSDNRTLDTHKESEVAAFYARRCIFITGASGFVGKVSVQSAR